VLDSYCSLPLGLGQKQLPGEARSPTVVAEWISRMIKDVIIHEIGFSGAEFSAYPNAGLPYAAVRSGTRVRKTQSATNAAGMR
jgi:hypothetical protein